MDKERKQATEKAMRTTARNQEKRQQRSLTNMAKEKFPVQLHMHQISQIRSDTNSSAIKDCRDCYTPYSDTKFCCSVVALKTVVYLWLAASAVDSRLTQQLDTGLTAGSSVPHLAV